MTIENPEDLPTEIREAVEGFAAEMSRLGLCLERVVFSGGNIGLAANIATVGGWVQALQSANCGCIVSADGYEWRCENHQPGPLERAKYGSAAYDGKVRP